MDTACQRLTAVAHCSPGRLTALYEQSSRSLDSKPNVTTKKTRAMDCPMRDYIATAGVSVSRDLEDKLSTGDLSCVRFF
jgi:hypothetical protein